MTACPQLSWNSVSIRISAALTVVFGIFVDLDSGSDKQRDKNGGFFEDGSFESAGCAGCFESRPPPEPPPEPPIKNVVLCEGCEANHPNHLSNHV